MRTPIPFRALLTTLVTGGTLAAATVLPSAAAVAATTPPSVPVRHDRVVSADPANTTPNVLDGRVDTVVQVGDRMILGGQFTSVSAPGSTTVVARRNLLAFDVATGAIDPAFTPAVDGPVEAIVVAPDQGSVYVAGAFETVDGVRSKSVARIDVVTGAVVPGFRPPALDGVARDVVLRDGRLWVAGSFTRVGPLARTALTALDPATGAVDAGVDVRVAGVHNGGTTSVVKMAVSPAGDRMVVIGNFRTVAGQPRSQVAVLALDPAGATLADWATTRYEAACNTVFDSYVRDVAVSPDGDYFVVVSTGAYSAGTLCDAAARFELGPVSGPGQQPSWVDATGGDTLTAVAISGPVVYLGGHQRWLNNPFASDAAGPGAVPRPGIAAVDPRNGLPYSWNPGRTRGVAVYDFLLTPSGLWFTSDTDRVAGERRERVAFFPLAGGAPVPAQAAAALPGRVYLGAPAGGTAGSLSSRVLTRTGAGHAQAVGGSAVDWSQVRGSVLVDGTLYTGAADGSFSARAATPGPDGLRFGAATPVDTADALVPLAAWHTTLRSATSLAYGSGRLYYTVAGRAALSSRTFEPESGIVGAEETTVSGTLADLDWRTVGGMFLVRNRLYTVDAGTGALRRTSVATGAGGIRPLAGTTTVVSGPGLDGADWRARAVFLDSGTATARLREPAPSVWPGPGPQPRKPAPWYAGATAPRVARR